MPDDAFTDVEVLLDHHSAPEKNHESRMPVWLTMYYTLSISTRFLGAYAIRKGSVAYGDELLDWYWRHIFTAGNAKLSVSGRRHFEQGKAYVVMSNHASLVDIPAMMGAIPGSMRMVTKEELTKIPIWGQALIASGFIPLDRKNRSKAIAQLERAKEVLQKGVSVWISPEGTRSRDGTLAAFKKGGFHVALDLGVPIIPAWIDGAGRVLPPDQFKVRYGQDVHVKFGAPISTAGRSKDNLDDLMKEVRESIVALSG
jgi:1-acyl-sn-glycerol-3-phosphate acyltransferase